MTTQTTVDSVIVALLANGQIERFLGKQFTMTGKRENWDGSRKKYHETIWVPESSLRQLITDALAKGHSESTFLSLIDYGEQREMTLDMNGYISSGALISWIGYYRKDIVSLTISGTSLELVSSYQGVDTIRHE